MPYTLPELPYARNALEPVITETTINYHYGKHHQTYVNNLNALLPEGGDSLEDLIRNAEGGVFNNAAQVWNHTFYWNCMTPNKTELKGELKSAIETQWGSVEAFVEAFTKVTVAHFGSGWSWLVKKADGSLEILSTVNAANPLRDGKKPLLCCDVWEHAYYLDYQNARATYVKNWLTIVNWDFVAENYIC
ncbi:hypothetical protein WA538_005912, partial [Blastocystis sp. DL]